MKSFKLLKELCDTHSVTGDTTIIKDAIKRQLSLLNFTFEEDGYGSIVIGKAKNAQVIIAAHIDEVGFQITKINEDGTMNILPVGWVFPNRLDHSAVYVNVNGKKINGAIFHKAILKSENISKFSDIFLSVGATNSQEVSEMGIRIGQVGSFRREYYEQNGAIFAAGLDNKVSVFSLLNLMLIKPDFFNDKLVVFHTDEEMQDHSANSIAFKYHIPYAVILDYCPVHQLFDSEDVLPKFGEGSMVVYRGGNHIIHEDIRNKLDNVPIFKAFISSNTLPGLEPDNFQNNGHTKALNLCISSIGYHGPLYAVLKRNIDQFQHDIVSVCNALLV